MIRQKLHRTVAIAVTTVLTVLAVGSCGPAPKDTSADYCAIMPDGEHVLGEPELLRRALLYCSLEEIKNMQLKTLKCIYRIGAVLDGANGGQMREAWILELRDVIDSFAAFASALQDSAELRVH